jgi:hypothetical protein
LEIASGYAIMWPMILAGKWVGTAAAMAATRRWQSTEEGWGGALVKAFDPAVV